MTILIAPNAFKDSLDVTAVANSIRDGLRRALPDAELIVHPVADGGDNTLDAVGYNMDIRLTESDSKDPLNRDRKAQYAILPDGSALIEMAKASGLHLLTAPERKAGITSSFGTGMLIADAIGKGCRKILLGAGGTATVDAGTGILKALGFRFIDAGGRDVEEGGFSLSRIDNIIQPPDSDRLNQTEITILNDVSNPLLGPDGAVRIFAPQKGASPGETEQLEAAVHHFCRIVEKVTGKDISSLPGGGAAGGVPAGLGAFLNVSYRKGAEAVLNITGFEKNLQKADLVITGEGKLDRQTDSGKAPVAVALMARKAGKKVIFIGGQVPEKENLSSPFDAVFSISPGITGLDEALGHTAGWLERTAFNIGKILNLKEDGNR